MTNDQEKEFEGKIHGLIMGAIDYALSKERGLNFEDDEFIGIEPCIVIRGIVEDFKKALDQQREDLINQFKQLPVGLFDSSPYLDKMIESLKKGSNER